MAEKKYYYFKLENTFFDQKEIKKLRKIPGGAEYTVIYLKMILSSLDTNGVLFYEGYEDTFGKEIALDLGENPDAVEITVAFLKTHKLLVECAPDEFSLVNVQGKIEGLSASALRVRRHRENKKATQQSLEIPAITASPLQCNAVVTPMKRYETKCNEITETETDTDTDTEIDIELSILDSCKVEDKGWMDSIRSELLATNGIPYIYSLDANKMTTAIHILTEWEVILDPQDQYASSEENEIFRLINDSLIEMACSQEMKKYGTSPAVTYAKVIDAINRCTIILREGKRISFAGDMMWKCIQALMHALMTYDVKSIKAYAKGFLWNYLSTYKIEQITETAKFMEGRL